MKTTKTIHRSAPRENLSVCHAYQHPLSTGFKMSVSRPVSGHFKMSGNRPVCGHLHPCGFFGLNGASPWHRTSVGRMLQNAPWPRADRCFSSSGSNRDLKSCMSGAFIPSVFIPKYCYVFVLPSDQQKQTSKKPKQSIGLHHTTNKWSFHAYQRRKPTELS